MKLELSSIVSPTLRATGLALILAGGFFAAPQTHAQSLVYSEDFDADHTANFIVNSTGGYSPADIFFDYSTVGIPSAPHSTGGSTRGLKLQANLDTNTAAQVFPVGVSVSPVGFGITENFDMRFDLWINYNGRLDGGGSGSTQVGGAGYGTAGTSAQVAGVADSVFIGATGDGGSSADYRVYAPAHAASYQDTDHIITTDPTTPFVYFAGTRNNTGSTWYTTNFLGVAAPAAQLALYPQQSNTTANGSIGMKWHDVSLKKVGNVITYRIDGILIATVDARDAGTLGGTDILFNHYDINAGASTDINRTNLAFTLIDNVRITNFPNIVTVDATIPNADENGTKGQFTITRTSAGTPITVNYTMTGTATNGVDYVTLPGSVTFAATATTTNIDVTPIDDNVSELPETVVLNITESPNYVGAGNATVSIADNDTPTFDVIPLQPTMYERHTNDFITFRLQRRGDLSASVAGVNVTYSGTAVSGVDYTPSNSIPSSSGSASTDFTISPLDNSLATGPKTVTVTVAPGSGYVVGTNNPSASGTILDDENPPATVLYSNSLANPAEASNWGITYGTGDSANFGANYEVLFGYDITTNNLATGQNGVIPPPPNGSNNVLRVTCNKAVNPGAEGAVNVYYTNQVFGGDYAVRFSMNLIEGGNLGAGTEGVIFGINHSGTRSNWWYGSGPFLGGPWESDGVWYYIGADGGSDSIGDYQEYTGLGGTNGNSGWQRVAAKTLSSFTNAFKNTPGPFTAFAALGGPSGIPANATPVNLNDASAWTDVEIKQVKNVITLSIDRTSIFVYTNTTVWTNGYIMLGYADPYGATGGTSVGNPDGAVYYSNVRVVSLTGPKITLISLSGGNATITFTSPDADDTADSFVIQSSSGVAGPYTDVAPPATITQTSSGTFQAVVAQSGAAQFYRIHHK